MSVSKFIIDTNIIFSALYSPLSNAGIIIEKAIEKKVILYSPEEVKKELERNLKNKLEMNEEEINFILSSLPINWLNKKLYQSFIKKAEKLISKKDTPILAAHYMTNYPIITGDKEFFQIKNLKIKTLREIVEEL